MAEPECVVYLDGPRACGCPKCLRSLYACVRCDSPRSQVRIDRRVIYITRVCDPCWKEVRKGFRGV